MNLRLLNVGCGGMRPQEQLWVNLDTLFSQLKIGTPERTNLQQETNYIDCDLLTQSIPFPDETFDGILCNHVIEHFSCHDAVEVLMKCRRVLKPGGLLVVSVPDAAYFYAVHDYDTRERAPELFGEPISPDEPQHQKFFDYALFHANHQQILTEDALRCLFLRSGFKKREIGNGVFASIINMWPKREVFIEVNKLLMKRRPFSIILHAIKTPS